MLTFELDALVPETERSMVNIQLTLALSVLRGKVIGHLDGSIQKLTDAQLFGAYRDLIERGGNDDDVSALFEVGGGGGWLGASGHWQAVNVLPSSWRSGTDADIEACGTS